MKPKEYLEYRCSILKAANKELLEFVEKESIQDCDCKTYDGINFICRACKAKQLLAKHGEG